MRDTSETGVERCALPMFILLCVRWYLRYSLSYRDLEEMMVERGLKVDHSTICRWVLAYAPELEKRVKPQLKPTTDSWRADETYIKSKSQRLNTERHAARARQHLAIPTN